MKCPSLFYGKSKKNTSISKCRLLIFLPSVNDSTVKNGDKPFLIVELNSSRLGKKDGA